MGARYFVPGIGRFLSADTIVPNPLNPQALNRYSYVYNRPINLNDPTGHCGADANWEQQDGEWVDTNASLTEECWTLRSQLEETYGISIAGRW